MDDENGEPSNSPPGSRHDPPSKSCEHCGAAIDTSDWYPVTKERDSDGSLRFYPFCSEECQDAWLDEQPD